MTKLSKSSNPVVLFNTGQNLIHAELLYQVIHGLQRRQAHFSNMRAALSV